MTAPTGGREKPAVYSLFQASRCYQCDTKLPPGAIVQLRAKEDEREVLCQSCSGLSDFTLLPAGNAKLTRLAPKYSPQLYIVLKWSPLWKCYERLGLLISKEAHEQLTKL